jgi:hypothetical protein
VSGLRSLPHDGPRVETGPVQFGDDWPGLFVRGDDALALAFYLRNHGSPLYASAIPRLTALLESCNAGNFAGDALTQTPSSVLSGEDE